MKGQIIAQEFNKIAWVSDKKGSEYACYLNSDRNVKSKEELSQKEQKSCVNLNAVLGDSW
jgi:hypothetical protein